MISQSIMKINLFLQGVIVRLKENIDYFSGMTVTFKSGVKEYYFSLTVSGEELPGSDTIKFVISDL